MATGYSACPTGRGGVISSHPTPQEGRAVYGEGERISRVAPPEEHRRANSREPNRPEAGTQAHPAEEAGSLEEPNETRIRENHNIEIMVNTATETTTNQQRTQDETSTNSNERTENHSANDERRTQRNENRNTNNNKNNKGIKKNTRAHLKIASLNMRGAGTASSFHPDNKDTG